MRGLILICVFIFSVDSARVDTVIYNTIPNQGIRVKQKADDINMKLDSLINELEKDTIK